MQKEILRRRTFAIISHPDAGKTTLTEKFLLYGGAVQLAGSVKARRHQRQSTSDWMELERKRGISVSSTVLQFDYKDFCINLLDTPGHQDFSEDTYRVLMAVDSVVMVIDAAKGIESQTIKLFEVCRKRGVPIFTFMNKLDRPTKDPLELIDELERVLGLHAYPMNWPLGSGPSFVGVYNRLNKEINLFEKTAGGAYKSPVEIHGISDAMVKDRLDELTYNTVKEELDMLDGAGAAFDPKAVLAGQVTPVYFGSAMNNFGIEMMLDGFLSYSCPPAERMSNDRIIKPDYDKFSGFIFKIQGNMDPNHRDRISFMRVCSGRFTRETTVCNPRTGKKMKLPNAHKVFGKERSVVDEAFPGDIVGVIGNSNFLIGDTLTEDPTIIYDEIPRFPPEWFSFIHNPTPSKFKPFRKGLDQLLTEGVVQSFYLKDSGTNTPLLAAVGQLQFEVVQFRLQSEYGADSRLESTPWKMMRWVDPGVGKKEIEDLRVPPGARLAEDLHGQLVVLFESEWALKFFNENRKEIPLLTISPK